MDRNIKNLQQNLAMALRSVPSEKLFDEVYQDIVKISKKVNLIENKAQKKNEKKVDNFFKNWSLHNGSLVNPNTKQVNADALQAIDDLIQKEQDNLNAMKDKYNKSYSDENDNTETLLG